MDLGFGLVLIAALLLGVGSTLYQHRTYQNATRRLGMSYRGAKSHFLVSGRGKSILRGAIVLLVVNRDARSIVAAEAMIGSTVLARFRPRPELLGDLDSAPDRAKDVMLQKAVVYGISQYEVTVKTSSKSRSRTT